MIIIIEEPNPNNRSQLVMSKKGVKGGRDKCRLLGIPTWHSLNLP
jgi:hypothetical protein